MDQDSSTDEGRYAARETGEAGSLFESSGQAQIADHKLLRRIGRGSYGEVWLARHTMGMYRAVKLVHRRFFKDRHPFERELSGIRKFEPISRSHEGFIDILHVGLHESGDYFYYIMELADDQTTGPQIDPEQYSPKTLARELSRRGTLDYQGGLQLGLDLSRAVAELHRNGLVHRDIKPSNILFVNGVPKLADIGLVSQADEARSYVGTEGFIPPEGPGTAQADVYALGKVLYEAVTGKDRLDYPELPSDWDSRTEHEQLREFNEVILHACNLAPQRYHSAQDMHADLVVLLAGKSVRRLKMLERQVARLKRVGALSSLILSLGAVLFYLISHERNLARQMRQDRAARLVAYGNSAMDAGDLAGALPYFAQVMDLDKTDPSRQALDQVRFESLLSQCPKIVQMWFLTNPVFEVGFSPDGRSVLAVGWMGQAQIFDSGTGQPLTPQFGQTNGLLRGSFSPDGRWVVTVSEDNTACVWRSSDGALVQRLVHPSRPMYASFSPSGDRLVVGCTDNSAWLWDTSTWTKPSRLVGHTNAVLCTAFSHNGKLVATGSRDGTVRIWDATTGQPLGEPLPHTKWVEGVAFSPDDTTLITACEDRRARLWDVKTRQHLLPDLLHDDRVTSAGFSPDGRLMITSCLDGTVRLWLTVDHQPFVQAPVIRHSEKVKFAAFSNDGHRFVSGCTDGTVRVWDLAGIAIGSELPRARLSEDKTRFLTVSNGIMEVWDTLSGRRASLPIQPSGQILDARLSADGRFAISLSDPGKEGPTGTSLEIWEAQNGRRLGPALRCTNSLANVRLSNNARRLLMFDTESVRSFDVSAGQLLACWDPEEGGIRSAIFNPEGDALAVWSEQSLSVCDALSGRRLFGPIRHPFPITQVEFSRDGLQLVSCGADSSFAPCFAQVRNALSGKVIGPQLWHGDGVLCSAFSPKADFLVTGGEDSKAFVWQLPSGTQQAFINHKDIVNKVAFSPDASCFVTASHDKTAQVWATASGYPLTPPLRHHLPLKEAAFLPDGRHLVITDNAGRSWIWLLGHGPRPTQEVMRLSQLYSGKPLFPATASPAGESTPEIWRQLQLGGRSELAVSTQQIANWYEFEAEESDLEGNPQAASFYLARLLSIRPGDEALRERLARARGLHAN